MELTIALRGLDRISNGFGGNSVWAHVYSDTNFILSRVEFNDAHIFLEFMTETKVDCGELPPDLWEFASERLLSIVHFVRGSPGTFRYFIVGKAVDGFVGIERDMSAEIATNESGKGVWKYKIMDPKECPIGLPSDLAEYRSSDPCLDLIMCKSLDIENQV